MRREERLNKELRFHLDQHIGELIARGHSPEEARRLARIELGGIEQAKEACRDVRRTRWIEDFLQDLRYALRTIRQRPGFAMVALATLALGIGATTLIFTVLDGVLLKPLPYADPDRLVKVEEQTSFSTVLGNRWGFSYPNYLDCARGMRSLDMAVERYDGGTISSPGPAGHAYVAKISANLLHVLGVRPLKGRDFRTEEDQPGTAPIAIVSYDLWQQRFGASDAALGSPLIFDGRTYIVVGVAPPRFDPGYLGADMFTLAGQDPSTPLQNRGMHGNFVWARLRSGTTLGQANAELAVIGRQLEKEYPKSNKGRTFIAEPIHPDVGAVRQTLWLLLGAVNLVLLIACANIASLFLARAVFREREVAMRAALGAGRGRLVRQNLTESAVLGLGGGAIGIVLAVIGLHPFIKLWPGDLPRAQEVQLDWRVLLFAVGISFASGLLFGLAPALRAASRDLEQKLRTNARNVIGSSRRLQSAFVVAQIALAMVLLVSAGMLARTMLRLSTLDPGVNIHNVLTARTALSAATLADPARTRAAWRDILDRARVVPGARSIAMIDTVPMRTGVNQIGYRTSAAALPADRQPLVLAASVTPEYLDVMGIPLRRGRFFTDHDRIGNESVVVIDDVMAKEAFPGQDPLGKQIWIGVVRDPAVVIGVVGHVRQWGLAGDDGARVRAQLYYPWAQVPDALVRRWSELMSIAVRTNVDPLTIVEPLRREIRGAANDQVLYEVRTLEQLASASLARQRFLLLLFAIFAALALLLAAIGIYGVLAYLTSLRVPEIGVRMALGATAGEVMWMVLRQSLGMVSLGVVVGVPGAWAAARLLLRLVTGMQPARPWTFTIAAAVLIIVALFAGFLPAHRASRIDPVRALRQE